MGHPRSARRGARLGLLQRRFAIVVAVAALLSLGLASPAAAAVTVSRAELSGSTLRLEGTATASRDISVDGVVMGRSDSGGRFRIERSGYTPPGDCTVDVNDGSATPRTATLSGCTATQPAPEPEPQPTAQLTPDVAQIGPGYVGSDFTTFSDTTTTITFGPDTLGPVRFEIISGQLPAGLQLVDPNAGFTPAKSIHASVSGTPTTVQTSTFTIHATDANGLQATRTYTIVINPARTLDFSPQTAPSFTVGTFTNWWMEGAGGVRPYRWTVSNGTLPPGTSLIQDNPDGPLVRVSGTPTAAGTYTFTLRLTDAQAATVSRTFTVTVAPQSTSSPPPAPTLLAPAEGAVVTVPVTLSWSQVLDPNSLNGGYNWRISTSPQFTSSAAADSTRPSVTEASVSGLAPGTYHWQVQAVSGEVVPSDWSAVRSFEVAGPEPPATTLSALGLSPTTVTAGGTSTGTVTLGAAAPSGGAAVALSSSSSAATVPAGVTVPAGATTATFPVGSSAVPSSTAATISATYGGTTLTATLTVSPSSPSSLTAPTLVSPANGAKWAPGVSRTFDWSDVTGAASYTLQVSTSSGFTSIELERTATASQVALSFAAGGDRFWRVRATNSDVAGPWSATRSFRVR